MHRAGSRGVDIATVAGGATAGLVSFGVGYVLTYAWRAPAVAESLRGLNVLAQLLGIDTIQTWKGVAWLFYGAHGVATRIPTAAGGTRLVNLVEQSGDGTVALLYVLVPVLLLLAGVATARFHGTRSAREGALVGATVVVGYLLPAAVGTVLTAHTIGDTGGTIAPDPVTGIILAGVIYPVVFGALGGAVSSLLPG